MAGGATFKYVNKVFDTYTFSVSYVLLILGFVLTIAANSLVMVLIGAVIVGMSISWTIPQTMLSLTNSNEVEATTMACSVGHIGGQIGTFCSSLVMTSITGLFSSSTTFRYVFTAVVCAVLAVVEAVIIKAMRSKAKAKANYARPQKTRHSPPAQPEGNASGNSCQQNNERIVVLWKRQTEGLPLSA